MAGLLAQIGRGLRMGGGVMNADIFAQQEQERMQQAQRAEQRKEALAQFIFQAAQGGMLPAEEAHKALQAVNPELAAQLPTGAFGPSVQTQQSQMKFQQEQQDRAARAAAMEKYGIPPGTPDSVVAALMKPQTPQGATSALGKLASDYRNGLISKEDYEAERRKRTYIAPQQQSQGNDQRARKIQALIDQGLDPARATNIVDRNIDIQINPATGRMVLTDLTTNTATEVPLGGSPPRAPVAQRSTLYEQAGQGTTGVVPFAAEVGSGVSGQLGGPVATDVIERRQALRAAQQDLVRALAVNPRFPVGEMEQIRQEVNITPGVLDSPKAMQARMSAIDRSLRVRLSQAARDAGDQTLPEDLRSAQAQNAAAIRNFLDQLGAPQGGPQDDDDALINKYLKK